jgi:biopolymer transport protein ExbD/biopolymer transport protein TolR
MPQIDRRAGTSLSEINIVPLVDVVLVLLIIFMITAPILQSGIEVELPKTQTVREVSQEKIVITIDRAQVLYLGNERVNINELGAKILERAPDANKVGVFVRADEVVPWGSLAKVLDAVRQSGIENASLVTEAISSRPRIQ